MPDANDFLARGTLIDVLEQAVVFQPAGTNYRLRLETGYERFSGSAGERIECRIRLAARKIWTVPSGGLFVTPIFGTPRIVQGRVKFVDERTVVVHAGTNFIVDLPSAPAAIDQPNGPIVVGGMVNVTALPGARLELAAAALR